MGGVRKGGRTGKGKAQEMEDLGEEERSRESLDQAGEKDGALAFLHGLVSSLTSLS